MSEKMILLGNEAIARGAVDAGVCVVSSYPGTPSTEITETVAAIGGPYAEWAANEKVAAEVAFGASVSGARSMCCMKHVGLNVAADLLYTAAYTGVNGGFVFIVADDPGMHSSQNEQDTRMVAMCAHVPVLEPADSQEAYSYVRLAFDMSEACDLPIIVRMTTRVSHTRGIVTPGAPKERTKNDYVKNAAKYVMMPNFARGRKHSLSENLSKAMDFARSNGLNTVIGEGNTGAFCGGGCSNYVLEAMPYASVFKAGMPYPLDEEAVKAFAKDKEKLFVIEEQEPALENQLNTFGIFPIGKQLFTKFGEYTSAGLAAAIKGDAQPSSSSHDMPMRPPLLCPGCPHRAAYTVVNKLKLTAFGDIGCYTLGANPPLSSLDSTICMGASIGMAQGAARADADMARHSIAVIGDSTFFHGGIGSVASAIYNGADITVLVLDNGTTGMTGHQDNPATGKTLSGDYIHAIPIENVCLSMGAHSAVVVDPFDLAALETALKNALANKGVDIVIARKNCVMIEKTKGEPLKVDPNKCINCGICLKAGCPAMVKGASAVSITVNMCTGCGLCASLCPKKAIGGGK